MSGFKPEEIAKCALCDRGVCHSGQIHFYHVRLAHHAVDIRAAQRRHGMETMMGGGQAGAALASILGPGEPVTKAISENAVFICGDCALSKSLASLVSVA